MPILTDDRPAVQETPIRESARRTVSTTPKTPSAFAPKVRERRSRRGTGLAGLAVVTATIVAVLLVGGVVASRLFQPFKMVTVDRTPPPVLIAMKDLSSFKAAAGEFEVLIDTEEDVKYLPSWLAGSRTLFIGVGSVDATVDFRNLTEQNVQVSPDRLTATIMLPPARLEAATVDYAKSHVVMRERGLKDRLDDALGDNPTNDQPLYEAAAKKMDAAAEAGELQTRAQTNTRDMLTRLLKAVGYENVTVNFYGTPVDGPISVTQIAVSPSA
jgi:Protein of unknown function (DUF4230)